MMSFKITKLLKKQLTELRTENRRLKEELEAAQKRPAPGTYWYDELRYSKTNFESGKTCVW